MSIKKKSVKIQAAGLALLIGLNSALTATTSYANPTDVNDDAKLSEEKVKETISELQASVDEAKAIEDIAQVELDEARAHKDQAAKDLEIASKDVNASKQDLQKAQDAYNSSVSAVRDAEKALEDAKSDVKAASESLKTATDKLAALNAEKSKADTQTAITDKQAEKTEHEPALNDAKALVANDDKVVAEAQKNVEAATKAVEENDAIIKDAQGVIDSLNKQIADKDSDSSVKQTMIEVQKAIIGETEALIEAFKNKIAAIDTEITRLNDELANINATNADKQKQVDALEAEKQQHIHARNAAQSKVDEAQTALDSAKTTLAAKEAIVNGTSIEEANKKLFEKGYTELSETTDRHQAEVNKWIEGINDQIEKSGKQRKEFDFISFANWMAAKERLDLDVHEENPEDPFVREASGEYKEKYEKQVQTNNRESALDATSLLATFASYEPFQAAREAMIPVYKKLGFSSDIYMSKPLTNTYAMEVAALKANACSYIDYSHYAGPMLSGESLAFGSPYALYDGADQWFDEFKYIQEAVNEGKLTWDDVFGTLDECEARDGSWGKYLSFKNISDEIGKHTGHFTMVAGPWSTDQGSKDIRYTYMGLGHTSMDPSNGWPGCVAYEMSGVGDYWVAGSNIPGNSDEVDSDIGRIRLGGDDDNPIDTRGHFRIVKNFDGSKYAYRRYFKPLEGEPDFTPELKKKYKCNDNGEYLMTAQTYYTPERLAQYYRQFLNEKGINTDGYETMADNYAKAAKAHLTMTHLLGEEETGLNTYSKHLFDDTTKYYVNTEAVDNDIATLKAQVADLESTLNANKAKLETAKNTVKATDKKISDIKATMTEDGISKQLKAKQAEKRAETTKQDEAVKKIVKCKALIGDLEAAIHQNGEDKVALAAKRDAVDVDVAKAKVAELNQTLVEAKQALADAETIKAGDQKKVDAINKVVDAIQAEIDKLSAHLDDIAKAEEDIAKATKNLAARQADVVDHEQKLKAAKDKVVAAEQDVVSAKATLEKVSKDSKDQIDAAQAKLIAAQANLDEAQANYDAAHKEYLAALTALQVAKDAETERIEAELQAAKDTEAARVAAQKKTDANTKAPKHMRQVPMTADAALVAPLVVGMLGAAAVVAGKKREK